MQTTKAKSETSHTLFFRVCSTGFFGGLFWSGIGTICAFLNFTDVSPATLMLKPWLDSEWSKGWSGEIVSVFMISVLSIPLALVYYLFFRRLTGLMPGFLYGVAIWLIIFLGLSRWNRHIPRLIELDQNTLVTTLCLMILYGVFIGYTIYYDYLDQQFDQDNHSSKHK
ncbi:YqhR family membrane protein [Amphibacillus sediminis]|uniref:YqhR family membrane protein n=1 Tax=Amphibacillus sediminis TaxID=360185 RepID=UPI0008334B6D|nr:YqhR family membrane protein [Amphibacillus sediminis]